MVDLVLRRTSLETGQFEAIRMPVAIERFERHVDVAVHVPVDVGNRETAFFGAFDHLARLQDARVDKHEGWRGVLAHVHDRHALRDADLVRGEPYALRGVHRLEQVVHQPAHGVVHGGDGHSALSQDR